MSEVATKDLKRSWILWGIAAIFYLYEMVLRVAPSVMTQELMDSFGATSTILGVLVSFYYYAYTLLQLPCGLILDKLGSRNLLGCSAVLCVVGSVLFACSDYLRIAQIGRFLIGAGSACAFISCLQIATQLFPSKYFPLLAGVTNMMGTLGGVFGGIPIAKAVNNFGWQNTTFFLAFIGALIACAIFVLFPKKVEGHNTRAAIPLVNALRKVLSNKQVIIAGIIAGLMYLPISAFSELWAIPFFMTKYDISNEVASLASATLFIGVALGSVFLAFCSRKLRSYVKTIRVGIIAVSVLFVPLILADLSLPVSFFLVFLIGLFTGAQVINFTCAKNNAEPSLSGTTIAFTNALVMLIGAIFQPILGIFLDVFWNGAISETGTRVYEISCYQKAVLTLPICLLLSYLVAFFMEETINSENA